MSDNFKETIKERIAKLREELEYHNHLYYVQNQPQLSDLQFDMLMRELEQLEKENQIFDINSPTQRVGNDVNQQFEQAEHKYQCYRCQMPIPKRII